MSLEETVYQQALQSPNTEAVLQTAHLFDAMGWGSHGQNLKDHAEYLTFRRAWPVRSDTLFGVDHHIYVRSDSPYEFRGFSVRNARKDKAQVSFGVDVAALQARLNTLGASPPLTVDGISGPNTLAAIKAFQSSHGIDPDGVVGPITLAALGMTGMESPPTKPSTSGTGIIAVKGLDTKSDAFKNKLVQISNALGINPDWPASVISFETGGTFSPSVQNPYSKATGLIQFMSSTARNLGTTLEDLRNMSDVEQLDWVYKYFLPYKGRMRNLEDTYLAVFMPSQMGKSADSVVASEGSAVYTQNSGFDRDQKGYFTVGDITSAIRGVYNAGAARGRIPVGVAIAAGGIGVGALAGVGLGTWYLLKQRRKKAN